MKIHDLFLQPIERPIDGVIKADDARNLRAEVEEYVVTRDVLKGLDVFTERYLHEPTANGVWISGFFGSGKSHLLKILSLILDGRPLPDGMRPADFLVPKIEGDETVRANLLKAIRIPARSILFNIDQTFDGIGGDRSAPILEVFVKVLNDLQGYYGQQGYIAKFERDLDLRGEFGPFKDTYLRITGSTWEADRDALATVSGPAFRRAYAAHFHIPEDEASKVLRTVREDYKGSIQSFAADVRAYIDRQPPGFRLNFFVDEVGQFVGQDPGHLLNLQTMAETLGTVCEGRAWIFVTSQADLEGIIGTFGSAQAQNISKIMGRFKTQLTLASADVREVIEKRLLAKKDVEPEVLTDIFDREKDNLQTLFRFSDRSVQFKGWRGSDEFCRSYPFPPYQFDLFQFAIQQLSRHGAFVGQHLSVGERSMLAVFQDVAKTLRDDEVGPLATFDRLYDGIAPSIRADMQTAIKMAERQLGDGLPIRILKALFLLKWVPQFKAIPRNVAILLIDRPDIDIAAHEKAVADALAQLESQAYLQHNEDAYEFLTDLEKDVEVEIKNTEIDDSQVAKLLGETLFSDVLRDPKIRYEGNGQDYPYARKLDDQILGREADVAVNVITTDHADHSRPTTLATQNTGKTELLAILPADDRLIKQARLYLKTQKYVQQNTGEGGETRKAILDPRSQQNSQRRSAMESLARDFLGKAPLYLNGSRLDTVGEGDARNRFAKAFQELISFAYPSLRMLKGTYDEDTLHDALLKADDLLAGVNEAPSEAEGEILTYVTRNQNNGERTSIEEIVRQFGRRPYGWPPMAVLTLVARLFRQGRVELRATELLDARAAYDRLRNTRQHGGVRVRLQQQFDATEVNALKTFHQEFFDRANPGTDARSVAEYTAKAMETEAHELSLLVDQVGRYPFLQGIQPVMQQLEQLAQKDYTFLLKNRRDFADDLLTAKEDQLSPVKAFMHGPQRAAYDEALAFLREEEANFAELPAAEVQPLRDLAASAHPYRGNAVPAAKAAVTKLRGLLESILKTERQRAQAVLDAHLTQLKATEDFGSLDEADQKQVLSSSTIAEDAVGAARFVTVVRDRVGTYTARDYPAQLTLAARLAAKHKPVDEPKINYTPASQLKQNCGLAYITTSDDLERWLGALREAALAELKSGNRISL